MEEEDILQLRRIYEKDWCFLGFAVGTIGTGTKNHKGTLRGGSVHYLPNGDSFTGVCTYQRFSNFTL